MKTKLTIISLTALTALTAVAAFAVPKPTPVVSPTIVAPEMDSKTKRLTTAFNKRDVNKDGNITLAEFIETKPTKKSTTTPASTPVR